MPEVRGGCRRLWCQQDGLTPNGKRLPLHGSAGRQPGSTTAWGGTPFRVATTNRSWLDDTGALVGMQQKLMRHAQVFTTMNDYGNALKGAEREANSRVVQMALRSA